MGREEIKSKDTKFTITPLLIITEDARTVQEPSAGANFKFTSNQLLVELAVLNKIGTHNNELDRGRAEQGGDCELPLFMISRSFLA